jgi:hypothetical protein
VKPAGLGCKTERPSEDLGGIRSPNPRARIFRRVLTRNVDASRIYLLITIPPIMTQTNGTSAPSEVPIQSNSHLAPLVASNLFFTPLPESHVVAPGKEKHGRYMLAIPWNRVSGWGQPTIKARQELTVDPLSGVMQYAMTCFEGMKVGCNEIGD